jgi:phospholipid/cholesterol/gamma-HCH transport system substrate-binding protein
MMNRRTIDVWVGIFVTIGFASIAFLALKVAGSESFAAGDSYVIKARFDNIGGLKVRASIVFDNESFEAVVSMNVDGRYKFPRDTAAKILTSGLLGEQYIGLSAGGDTVDLKNGDTLKIAQSAIVLENLISQFLYSKASEGNEKK